MSVGTRPLPGDNFSSGFAWVALPSDIERDKYIGLCYRTESVCLRSEDGAFYNKIPISTQLLDHIEFPETILSKGSMVVYVNNPLTNNIIILGILGNKETSIDRREGQFKLNKTSKKTKTTVEVSGSAREKTISLIVNTEESTGGEVNIRVINKAKTGKLNVFVSGDIDLQSTGKLNLLSFEDVAITTQDANDSEVLSFFRQNPKEQHFETEKWSLNEAEEAATLGNKLKVELEKNNALLQAILNILNSPQPIVEPGNGAPSALQLALRTAITGLEVPDYSKILSEKMFIS